MVIMQESHNGVSPTALSLRGVHRTFGDVHAVDDFSLSVAENEVVCLLGPSGCGKTTVLRLAAGLETPDAGEVALGGAVVSTPAHTVPPEKRGIGLVVQDYALFPHLTIGRNVAFGLAQLSRAERKKRVGRVLRLVGMECRADDWPQALSGGEAQRIALARALAPAPQILLLDEPFSALDSALRRDVRDQTLHLLKESGASVLLVTHDSEEAMFMADKIALMEKGQLVQIGTPEEIYFNPVNAFATGFLGEVNCLPGQIAQGGVETPLGRFATDTVRGASRLSEGTTVFVLMRAEGLELVPADDNSTEPAATVLESRTLGRTSIIHMHLFSLEDQADRWHKLAPAPEQERMTGRLGYHLHARVAGSVVPPSGTRFHIRPDPPRLFVFPASR